MSALRSTAVALLFALGSVSWAQQTQRDVEDHPAESQLVELRLYHERVLQAFWRDPSRTEALEARLEDLLKRSPAVQGGWEAGQGVASQYRAEDLAELHEQLRRDLQGQRGLVMSAEALRAEALARLRDLRMLQRRTLDRLEQLHQQLGAHVSSLPADRQAEIETETSALRSDLRQSMEEALRRSDVVAERAGERAQEISQGLSTLVQLEEEIYWERLASRDSGVAGTNWGATWSALRSILAALSGSAVPVEAVRASTPEVEIFGGRVGTRARAESLGLTTRTELGGLSGWAWLWIVVSTASAVAVGLLAKRAARRRSVPLAAAIEREYRREDDGEERPPALSPGVSSRIDLLGLNMVGDLTIPLLLGVALVVLCFLQLSDSTVRTLFVLPVLMIVGTILLVRLVHHLFEADSPPHRVIPCADEVARHYRQWLEGILIFSVVLLLAPLELHAADLGAPLRDGMLAIYKTGLLALLLAFLMHRRRVLGLIGSARTWWTNAAGAVLYPLLVAVVAALLALQLIGFGLLVTYLGQAVVLSGLALLLIAAATEYLIDLIGRRRGGGAVSGPAPEGPRVDGDEDSEVAERRDHLLGLLASVIRLVALLAAAALVIRIWRIPVADSTLGWRTSLLGGLVLLVGLILDRILAATFAALHRSGRLPGSTTLLIRRWLRSALIVLVLLTLVALAGWQIQSIWTFLTALLAMIAIGFVAVWSILSNILATIVILIWKPFSIGELVEIEPDGISGRVIDLSFIFTTLKDDEGRKISVPNNLFAQRFIARRVVSGKPRRTLAEQLEREKPLGE